jgi:hypothetical protein
MTHNRVIGLWLLILALSLGLPVPAARIPDSSYLPLSIGYKWVLRNARQNKPVIFEVVERDGDGFRIRSITPWGLSEWTLVGRNGQYFMTGYGTGNGMMPVPDGTLYFDFSRRAGTKWSNQLGTLTVASGNFVVHSAAKSYTDCVMIIHKYPGGSSAFTFSKEVGFVQFGEGSNAFVLDESASNLPGSAGPAPAPSQPSPAPKPVAPPAPLSSHARPLFGLTANRLATDPDSSDAMIKRFGQTLDTGVNFVVANGNWTELEPRAGRYNLDSLNYLLSVSKQLPVSFTLRIINTIDRDVPPNIRRLRWNDPRMESRLFGLIDALAPLLNGRVRWFMLGYEINEYMNRHPQESGDFIELYRAAAAHVKERVPSIEVSSTLMFSGIDQLSGRLAALNPQLDFIALTYSPLEADFSVKDHSVLPADFQAMSQVAAGRKVVLQEIGYPSSPVVNSSQDKQADFYRLAFQYLDARTFEAANWMVLGDLSDAVTKQYSQFYGLKGASKFEAVLQTMGVFDAQGKPKKSWDIFRQELRR